MAVNFQIENIEEVKRIFNRTPEEAGKGIEAAAKKVKSDWVAKARDVAPIDSGNLRRQTQGRVNGRGMETIVKVMSNAGRTTGFNYAYYIHEMDAGGRNVKGEKKYLDVTAEQRKDKWAKWFESEIKKAVKKAGW